MNVDLSYSERAGCVCFGLQGKGEHPREQRATVG